MALFNPPESPFVPTPSTRIDVNWDMVGGGLAFDDDVDAVAKQPALLRPPRGVFAEFPGATPKYAFNEGDVGGRDFREQMARMFIQVRDYNAFVNSFTDPSSRQIAAVIGGVASADGKTSTTGGNGYIDFLLQNVQHGFQEKTQVIETLGDDHVAYFFGQGAPTFNYSGTLINTKQDDQAMNMLRMYRDMGRGTQLAARKTLISLRYDGVLVSGAMLNLSLGLNAEMEMAVPFNFSLLVKQMLVLPNSYGALVQLKTPFAVNGFSAFGTGTTDLATINSKPTLVPPVISQAAITPAATPAKATTPVADYAALKTLSTNATPQKTPDQELNALYKR